MMALSEGNGSLAENSSAKTLLPQNSNREGRNWSTKLKLKDKEFLTKELKNQSLSSSNEILTTENIADNDVIDDVTTVVSSSSSSTTGKVTISSSASGPTNNLANYNTDQSQSLSRRRREVFRVTESSTENSNLPIRKVVIVTIPINNNNTATGVKDNVTFSFSINNATVESNVNDYEIKDLETQTKPYVEIISTSTLTESEDPLLVQKLANHSTNHSESNSMLIVDATLSPADITIKSSSPVTVELNKFESINELPELKIHPTPSSTIDPHSALEESLPITESANIADSFAKEQTIPSVLEVATTEIESDTEISGSLAKEQTIPSILEVATKISPEIESDTEISETKTMITITSIMSKPNEDSTNTNVSITFNHTVDSALISDLATMKTSTAKSSDDMDEMKDSVINSENFVNELPIATNVDLSAQTTLQNSSNADTATVTENLVFSQIPNETILNGHKIGVLLFTIPPVDTLNNTIIPDAKMEKTKPKQVPKLESSTESSDNSAPSHIGIHLSVLHLNDTSIQNSSFSVNSPISPHTGVLLPILTMNDTSVQNSSLSIEVPLSIPCQKFMFINCTPGENTYDILDNQGTFEANYTEDSWVTLRPLPKGNAKTRLENGFFHNIFGDENLNFELEDNSHELERQRGSRKYNFTDHFKLTNCSRVNATEDDESDNEIKCYSTFGPIRLSIIDEGGKGSSSSSSSSSSEEEGSVEQGSEEEGEGSQGQEEKVEEEEEEDGEEKKEDENKDNNKNMNGQRRFSKQRKSFSKRIEKNDNEEEEDEENEDGEEADKEEGKGKNDGKGDDEGENEEDEEKNNKEEDEENENDENEEEKNKRKISPRFRPSNVEKTFNRADSSEEYDEEEEEEEEEEGDEEEEEEEGETNKKKKGYGSSPIKLDEKIPSSVCFVKEIVGKVKFEGYDDGEFVWLPTVQTEVLWAYYWGFLVTQIPGARLSGIVGGKIVILVGIVFAGLITLLSPTLASTGPYWLLTGRVLLGMSQGVCIPALQSLLAQWAPPLERTRMVAYTYSGIALGAALGGPFSEYLVQVIGWKILFYAQGILALLWGIFWFFVVSDSPVTHPKITNKEKQLILNSIGQQHAGREIPVPWCSIIRSQHVLALMLAQGSFKWAWHNLIHYAPRYVLTVLHRNRSETEWVWGVAFGCMFVTTCAYGAISDWLRKSRKTSTEFVRRAANSVCSLITAAFLVGVAQSYCNFYGVKVCFALAIAIGVPGAFSGIYANSIDLAPNHAAVITGICGTFATTANVLAPFYWNLIVYERPTLERWRTIWYTSAIFLLLANCLYFLLVGAKEQRFNRPVTLTKTPKRREEEQGAIAKRRTNYPHAYKNQGYASTEHL